MNIEEQWVVVETVAGMLRAEILRGLLEAQGLTVFLSQEGVGHSVYGLTVGRLGAVDVLVPAGQAEQAQAILEQVETGKTEPAQDQAAAPEETGGEEEAD
jgi:hypothetical protein